MHEAEAAKDPPSRLEWEITPMGEACKLRVLHADLREATTEYSSGGWETIFSGLKRCSRPASRARRRRDVAT